MIARSIRKSSYPVIPYITAGLPDLDTTGKILGALAAAGAPAMEVGIPFSDPTADGPVLQQASNLALNAGFTMDSFFHNLIKWCSSIPMPIIVMTYINPLIRMGMERALSRIKDSGVSGIIIPDLPRDASGVYRMCSSMGLDLIRLIAPTTGRQRAKEILSQCSGFVYAVSVMGVTGPRDELPDGLVKQVDSIKELTSIPVCVGFGVSKKAQVNGLLDVADGVIVGSYLVSNIMSSPDPVKAVTDAYMGLVG